MYKQKYFFSCFSETEIFWRVSDYGGKCAPFSSNIYMNVHRKWGQWVWVKLCFQCLGYSRTRAWVHTACAGWDCFYAQSWRGILLLGCTHPWVLLSRFVLHALSYELCMLGFWNFIYGFLMEKLLTLIFFFFLELCPVLEVCPFKKLEWNLLCKISRKLFEQFEQILSKFSGVMALWKFGHFKLVSKISGKLFELGAWNLNSWQGMISRLPD